jgi:hypothetical protein
VSESPFPKGRARGRLSRAREDGYLNAACEAQLADLHGRWCWHLKIPVIWMERCSPRSRFGRVHLDLFTTPRSLTVSGRDALRELTERLAIRGQASISPHDACWERVPVGKLEELASAVFRTVNRSGNYEWDLPQAPAVQGPAKVLPFPRQALA